MDRKSAIDRLYHLYEEKDIAEWVRVLSTGKMREEATSVLEELVAEIKQLHEEFPMEPRLQFPTFEVRTQVLKCPECEHTSFTQLPVADAVQCNNCGHAFSEGLGK